MRILVVVAAALLRRDVQTGKASVLLAQRPAGKALAGTWEFPGGKIEHGEQPEAALSRELLEELGITVEESDLSPLTFASHSYEEQEFHLLMPLYSVTKWQGEPTGAEGQALEWATAETLDDFEYPPADMPLLDHVRRALAELQ